jgi:hypothetical protein
MSLSACDSDTSGDATAWTTDLRSAVFTIWVTGTLSVAFPILSYYRSSAIRVPRKLFEYVFPCLPGPNFIRSQMICYRFAKYIGSGVIIATAFIHLLVPAIGKLTSPCLGAAWITHVRTPPIPQ